MIVTPLIKEYKSKATGGIDPNTGKPLYHKYRYLLDIAEEGIEMFNITGDTLLAWVEIGDNLDLYCEVEDKCKTSEELKKAFISLNSSTLINLEEVDWKKLWEYSCHHSLANVIADDDGDIDMIEDLYKNGDLETIEELFDGLGNDDDY